MPASIYTFVDTASYHGSSNLSEMSRKEINADPNSASCLEDRRAKSPAPAAQDLDGIRDSFLTSDRSESLCFLGRGFGIHFFKKLSGQKFLVTEQMLDAEAQMRGNAVVGGHAAAH